MDIYVRIQFVDIYVRILGEYFKIDIFGKYYCCFVGTPTRIPDREGFPFRSILTDLRGMSIFKMTDIVGYMEN